MPEEKVIDKTDLKWIHQRLSDQIDREFELLGQRLTWLITGSAFLFTTTAITLNKKSLYMEVPIFFSVFILGLLLCYVAHVSMTVARTVINNRKNHRKEIESKLKKKIGFTYFITVSNTDTGHKIGNKFYRLIPQAITFIWLFLGVSYIGKLVCFPLKNVALIAPIPCFALMLFLTYLVNKETKVKYPNN